MNNKKILSKISVMLLIVAFGFGLSLAPAFAEDTHSVEKAKAPEVSKVVHMNAEESSNMPKSQEDKPVPVPTPVPPPVPAVHHEDGNGMGIGGQSEGSNAIESENGQNGHGTSTRAVLAAQDFGVVNYDTGLGILKGYTAGFGLTNATFANAQSVTMKLYSSTTLLQTNTATSKVGMQVTGAQISSPFDVLGTFNYAADGFWINVREPEYGLHLVPTKVVAVVKLANGQVVTAENSALTGDSTIIIPSIPGPILNNIMSANIESHSASVEWLSSELANGRIWISTTTPVNVTGAPAASNASSSLFHFLSLSGLSPATMYHYIVASTNGSGGISFSLEGMFTTAP